MYASDAWMGGAPYGISNKICLIGDYGSVLCEDE